MRADPPGIGASAPGTSPPGTSAPGASARDTPGRIDFGRIEPGFGAAGTLPPETLLGEAFTPTRPQRTARRFTGRQAQLARIQRALVQERAHVVIFAERGRGKTSLSYLAADHARRAECTVARFSCAMGTSFDDILRGLMRDLPRNLLSAPAVADQSGLEGCEAALPAGLLQPRDVLGLPERLSTRHLVLIVDEFDRLDAEQTRTRLADTIKQVSDRAIPVSFVLVGVADSLEHLLGHHPSIQRNIVGIPLPLMADEDIRAVIERGSGEVGLRFMPDLQARIVQLARGVPYIAQLLSLHAGSAALDRGSYAVDDVDLDEAVALALEQTDPHVLNLYAAVTSHGRDPVMVRFLCMLASGDQDAFGRFRVMSMEEGVPAQPGIGPRLLEQILRAGIVRPCVGAGPDLFTFAEAGLAPYILLLSDRQPADAGASPPGFHRG
ncbi:MAG: AAA family ATPase [Janthinobacterium lividum]